MFGIRLRKHEDADVDALLKAAVKGGYAPNPSRVFVRCVRDHLPQFYSHLKTVQNAIREREGWIARKHGGAE
jgi:hypothetical protein